MKVIAASLVPARDMVNGILSWSAANAPCFIQAQLVYSKIVDASGLHKEASTLRTTAQSATTHSPNTISISALR